MSSSACPFCQQLFPLSELERHANNHLVEEEFERDLELARRISLDSTSPCRKSGPEKDHADYSEFFYGGTSGSRVTAYTSGHGEEHIHEKISCLSSLQIRSSFHKVEGGLMLLLRRCLELERGNSVSILTENVDHFQSLESEDSGWGCGWRNIQMLSSHLLMQRPEASQIMFGGAGFVPDIPSLQRWLEIAWERNFDITGSCDFNKKVYGLTKWIGTTECATLFRSFGLRARVVDFGSKEVESSPGTDWRGKRNISQVSGPMDKFVLNRHFPQADPLGHGKSIDTEIQTVDGLGPSTNKNNYKSTNPGLPSKSTSRKSGHQILMEWVWNYFADKRFKHLGSQRVIVSEKTPLYFQHHGHSRTIVGIQARHQSEMPKQYTLLILDPGHRTETLERSLRENAGWQKHIKRGVHTLKKPQYQLCYIDPGIARGNEMEQLKIMDSILFEL